jgi:hypothetical protein
MVLRVELSAPAWPRQLTTPIAGPTFGDAALVCRV